MMYSAGLCRSSGYVSGELTCFLEVNCAEEHIIYEDSKLVTGTISF